MSFLKGIALSLWNNHRKKAIAFLLGLLFAGFAAISGIPLEEIKDAARDAAKPAPESQLVPPSAIPVPAAPAPEAKPAEAPKK